MKYNNYRINDINNNLSTIGINPLDVMVTGVTGAGKSTTLNSLFNKTIAKVGDGVDPETMNLDSYILNDSFRIWDTPGLGDGLEQDKIHSKKIIDLLYKDYYIDNNQYGFIDVVLVVLDGGTRDMGTTYKLLNEVIIPNFQKKRVLIAINQADMAMKGRNWDNNNRPNQKLIDFLDEKAISIQKRVKEATNIDIIKPISYSAKYSYNIDKLFDLIIDNMPKNKRTLKI
jgi:predicted GTPase